MKKHTKSVVTVLLVLINLQLLAMLLWGWSFKWWFLGNGVPVPVIWPETSKANSELLPLVALKTTRLLTWPATSSIPGLL